LRGERVESHVIAGFGACLILPRALYHGVVPALAERLRALDDAPADVTEAARVEARRALALDAIRDRELRELISALTARGLRALLMKGAHLAYSHYERPDLRTRADTDLLIAASDRDAIFATLEARGYQRPTHVAGTLVMYQAIFTKGDPDQLAHVVDVHWRVANPQVFADLLTYDELAATAVPVPALGPGAWGPSEPHALLLACVHRVAHHYGADLMHWLYDIHLIASRMTEAEWKVFVALAEERGVASICWQSLADAASDFGTALPALVVAAPHLAHPDVEARTSAFLRGERRHIEQVVSDLRALPTWRDRVRLMTQHVFPSAAYMRTQYAPASSAPLPVLYVRRALHGARKWLARP